MGIFYDIYFKSLDDILNKGKEWKAWTYSDFDKKNMFKFIKKYRLTHPVTILKTSSAYYSSPSFNFIMTYK